MKLFAATCETDTAVIGAYPQIYHYSIEGHERPYDSVWGQRTDVGRTFTMNGVMSHQAVRTHVLSCVGLSPGRGLVVEDSVVELMRPYLPGSCLLHPFEVRDAMNDAVHRGYSYLEVTTTSELLTAIDFPKSSFCTSLFDEYQSEIEVASGAEWESKQQEENQRGSSLVIRPRTLSLKRGSLDAIGVIRLPFSGRILFTEPLVGRIRDAKVTGLELAEEDAISLDVG